MPGVAGFTKVTKVDGNEVHLDLEDWNYKGEYKTIELGVPSDAVVGDRLKFDGWLFSAAPYDEDSKYYLIYGKNQNFVVPSARFM